MRARCRVIPTQDEDLIVCVSKADFLQETKTSDVWIRQKKK